MDIINKIEIEIYNGASNGCATGCTSCPTGCGTLSVEEQVDQLRQDLQLTFGDSVEVKYIDTDIESMDQKGYCQKIIEAGFSYPITFISGQPRIAGGINASLVREYLDQIAFEMIQSINASATGMTQ